MSPDLRTVLEYPDYTEVSIRFSDQDSMGHLNNVAYAAYLEAGRIDFLHRRISEGGAAASFILAHIAIDYIREAHYPGVLRIGNAIERIGSTSVATCHGMFKDGELVAAGPLGHGPSGCRNPPVVPGPRQDPGKPGAVRAPRRGGGGSERGRIRIGRAPRAHRRQQRGGDRRCRRGSAWRRFTG